MSNEQTTFPICALCGAELTFFDDMDSGFFVDRNYGADYDPTDHVHRTFATVHASTLRRGDDVAVNVAAHPTDTPIIRACTIREITLLGDRGAHNLDRAVRIVCVHGTDEHEFTVSFLAPVKVLDDPDFTGK